MRGEPDGGRDRSGAGGALLLGVALLAGCWDDPVRETVTVDLRQPRRVGLSVAIELDSPKELQDQPASRRSVELAAADLIEGRHAWNERFAALDCAVESGGWQKKERELRRYELAAECTDPGAFGRLLSDRQLVAELVWEKGGGELRLAPNGGGASARGDRQRLGRELDAFTRAMERYVEAIRAVAHRSDRHRDRAPLLWQALLVETDPDAVGGLTSEERSEIQKALDAMGEVLGAFEIQERAGEPRATESLDQLARRVFDPLPRRFEIVTPAQAELEVVGFLQIEAGRFAVPPRGIEGALVALEGRWFRPDPALALLRQVRSATNEAIDLRPFVESSILRSDETIDSAALRQEIEASLAPPAELRLRWHRKPAPDATSDGARPTGPGS